MNDDFEITLTEETEKNLYEIMYSMDVKNTTRFWIKDKHGYSAFYEKVIHCKDCKWADWYTAGDGRTYCYCHEMDKGGFEEDDFCSSAERKEA